MIKNWVTPTSIPLTNPPLEAAGISTDTCESKMGISISERQLSEFYSVLGPSPGSVISSSLFTMQGAFFLAAIKRGIDQNALTFVCVKQLYVI